MATAQSQLIMRYKPGASAQQIANMAGVTVIDHSPFFEFALLEVPVGVSLIDVQNILIQNTNVVFAEENLESETSESGSNFADDLGRVGGKIASVYGSEAINVANPGLYNQIGFQLTKYLSTDRRVRVAVLDSGFSPYHRRMWARSDNSYNAIGGMFNLALDFPEGLDTNGNGTFDDGLGHGTFVSSIVMSLAPYAEVVNVKVSDSDGISHAWALVKGLTYAAHMNCELVNLSLGSIDHIVAMSDMVDWTTEKGMTLIAAAGNDNLDRIRYPARISNVISVTGIDKFDKKASFSSYENRVNFCAPSDKLIAGYWNGGLAEWSGTSFAAPIVTALLADVLRTMPRKTHEELKIWIENRGVNIDNLNPTYAGELGLKIHYNALRNPPPGNGQHGGKRGG